MIFLKNWLRWEAKIWRTFRSIPSACFTRTRSPPVSSSSVHLRRKKVVAQKAIRSASSRLAAFRKPRRLALCSLCSWMDQVGPLKFVGRRGVNCHRHSEKETFVRGKFCRAIFHKHKKHPRNQLDGVTIGKLPAAGIAMAPKRQGHRGNDQPNPGLEPAAFPKQQEEKRTGKEDGAAKRIKSEIWKLRVISESFEQTFLHVPWDGMDREQAAPIPWLAHEIWNMRVAKVKDGAETGVIVGCGQDPKNCRHDEKQDESREALPKVESRRWKRRQRRSVARRARHKIQEKRQGEDEFRAVAHGHGKKRSGYERSRINEDKIKRSRFTQHGKAKRDLPRPGKPQIAPGPRPKHWKEREQDSPGK